MASLEGHRLQWLSDQLVEPTNLVFAIVIASSLELYRDVLVHPIHDRHYIAALALASVYTTTVWSWIGWHQAMARYPYDVSGGELKERWRFYADLGIVIAYAYMLFRVEPLITHPDSNILPFLVGFPIVFILYFFENTLRVLHFDQQARRRVPLTVWLAVSVAITICYRLAHDHFQSGGSDKHARLWLNGLAIVAAMLAMRLYRLHNDQYRRKHAKTAASPVS